MSPFADWKNPADYPSPDSADNNIFAWEFLRRSPDYQAAWDAFVVELRELAGEDGELNRLADYLDAGPGDRAAIAAAHFPEPGDWLRAYSRLGEVPGYSVQGADDGTSVPLPGARGAAWGLASIANPRISWGCVSRIVEVQWVDRQIVRSYSSFGIREIVGSYSSFGIRGFGREPGVDHFAGRWLALVIDLEASIELIERRALALIRQERRRRLQDGNLKPITARARKRRQLVEGLRILDARGQRVPYA